MISDILSFEDYKKFFTIYIIVKFNSFISQITYSLVMIFELNSVPVVQYKDVMMIDDGKYQ